MRKAGLTDATLCDAVAEMAQGLIDADLGGDVLKKRIALPGRGKRGGARSIVATNRDKRWFFIFGFEKNERDNISDRELVSFHCTAAALLSRSDAELEALLEQGELKEICDGAEA